MEINITPDHNAHFKDVLHVIPQCILTVPVTVKYLINIDIPEAQWKVHYTTLTLTDSNHVLIEYLNPKLGALVTIAAVMIFHNYVV